MKLLKPTAEFFIPDQKPVDEAIKRTTHMSIAAHQDDIEIMAYDGIIKCFNNLNNFFFGVVVTNGSGSARDGEYAKYTDEEMIQVRKLEQKKAAYLGEVFDSQIAGGKRYDLATMGRRLANATYSESHSIDKANYVSFAMDLTPLIEDDNLDIISYVTSYIERFNKDVKDRIGKML